jgi:hypothetical protein
MTIFFLEFLSYDSKILGKLQNTNKLGNNLFVSDQLIIILVMVDRSDCWITIGI